MEEEFLQLAREAVGALQAANRTSWVDVAGVVFAGTQLLVSGVGLVAILVGLVRMKEAGARRDREIDELAGAFRRQGEAMTQAFTQQGQALERQGEVLAEALRGLKQQDRALEELLRRSA